MRPKIRCDVKSTILLQFFFSSKLALGLTSLKITVLDTGHQDEESRTGKHFYSCGGTGGPTS
jgi:hypothetical protein